jgi:hypothetical protein
MPAHFVPPVGVEDVLAGRLHDVLPIILAVATIRSPRTADFPETIHRPLAAFASMTSPGSSTLLLPLRVHGSACAGLKKGSARAAVDVTRTIPRGRHDPFTSPSGGRRGAAQGPPPNRQRDRDHPSAARAGGRRGRAHRFSGKPSAPAARLATAHPHRASVAIKVRSAVRLPVPPGPSTRLRRFLHLAYPSSTKNRSPRASGDILRIIRAAATAHSPRASGADSGVLTGRLRDRLRTIRHLVPAALPSVTPTSSG